MPDTFTANLNLDQPAVGADSDTWGSLLNSDLGLIDAVFNPDGSGTSVGMQVGSGKTLKVGGMLSVIAGAVAQFVASTFKLIDDSDATKVVKFLLSGLTTGQTRTLTVPDASGTLVLADNAQTLTNKTYDTAGAGNVLKINGTQISAVTGTGAAVLANSPALTGTPTAPTAALGTAGSQVASLDYVLAAIAGGIPSTGDLKPTHKTTADAGWILWQDGTIGSASSGATVRANADTQALYTLYWNGYSDTICPVTGGRGASAAADFAANKPLQLPRGPGRALVVAGAGVGLTARTLGDALGAETHAHGGWTSNENSDGIGVAFGQANSPSNPHQHLIFSDTSLQPSGFINVMIKL